MKYFCFSASPPQLHKMDERDVVVLSNEIYIYHPDL